MMTLGRYRIAGALGKGTLTNVYRGTDSSGGRTLAVKVLRTDLPPELRQGAREHFLREARAAARLQHPHIAALFDIGDQGDAAFIAMELLEGLSLERSLRESDRLPFPRIGEIIAQLADALDYAHGLGVVHRDVRPANIFISPSGEAKLADFGLAYTPPTKDGQPLSARSAAKYCSPQQALKQPLDPSTDIFSLGVVLYEMLARRTPFELPDETKVLALKVRIAREPYQPVRQIDATIPAGFDRVLARALAKLPKDRYARACDMADALRAMGLAPLATPAELDATPPGPATAQPVRPAAPAKPPPVAQAQPSAADATLPLTKPPAPARPAASAPTGAQAQPSAADATLPLMKPPAPARPAASAPAGAQAQPSPADLTQPLTKTPSPAQPAVGAPAVAPAQANPADVTQPLVNRPAPAPAQANPADVTQPLSNAPAPAQAQANPADVTQPLSNAPAPAQSATQAQESGAGMDLLGDLDAFSRTLDEQAQAIAQAAEEENRLKLQEAQRRADEEAKRLAGEATVPQPPASASAPPEATADVPRSAVLEMLKRQGAARPVQGQTSRAQTKARIDGTLRAALKYLSELAAGVNSASPELERPYELIYLARPPAMTLAEAFTDLRTTKVDGDNLCDFVFLKFRASYASPARAEVTATDMELCKRMLDAAHAPFEVQVLKKNDFGQPTHVAYVLNDAIPCEITLRGNYEAGTIAVEILNVGRFGKANAQLPLEQFNDSLLDEIGKFILGAPNGFAHLVLPGVRPAQAAPGPSALERLKRQGTARPAAGQAASRAQTKARIDRMLRAALKYLSELAAGVNSASPALERPYELLYLPRPPTMTLAEAFTDLRNRKVDGDNLCDFVFLKFRASYASPARAEVTATDMELCKRMLDAAHVPFEVQVLKKNDFGQPTHVAYVLNAAIPCEITLRGNYEAGTIAVEILNVGRFGKADAQLTLDLLSDTLLDEIGKFILGAPNGFAQLVLPGTRPAQPAAGGR